jgi:glycosyltransferase involved in cell wall biosynthesis
VERVRPITGGTLVIAGDGPETGRLRAMAGQSVTFTGRVSEEEKHRLLSAAWILVHPAMIEGWGIVVAEAALRSTPAIGFAVPGLKDSVLHGQTGLLVGTDSEFAAHGWPSRRTSRRHAMGRAARDRAVGLQWSAAVDGFADVAVEAIARAGRPRKGVTRSRASR